MTEDISIHALLAESDWNNRPVTMHTWRFLSTLSLRRATQKIRFVAPDVSYFYPRSPCGERPSPWNDHRAITIISIHALLAESDEGRVSAVEGFLKFLSTLSLRRATLALPVWPCCPIFLSTLSLRRATVVLVVIVRDNFISIHALLAESDNSIELAPAGIATFLSTLSLRRATFVPTGQRSFSGFLSTLSLRRATQGDLFQCPGARISIHALLAESD